MLKCIVQAYARTQYTEAQEAGSSRYMSYDTACSAMENSDIRRADKLVTKALSILPSSTAASDDDADVDEPAPPQ